MPDHSTLPPSDSEFLARVLRAVLERYASVEAFEQAMKWQPGFVHRELLSGELPATMIADQLVRSLHCSRDWLLTGVGEPFQRKAPQVPEGPLENPPSAVPIDTRNVRANESERRGPATRLRASTRRNPAVSADGSSSSRHDLDAPSTQPAAADPFSVTISAATSPDGPDDRSGSRSTDGVRDPASADGSFDTLIRTRRGDGAKSTETSTVHIPKAERAALATGDTSGPIGGGTTDSFVIESIETDGDADRALFQAVQRQRKLLRTPPSVPGLSMATMFLPAKGVSSEFYDFIEFGSGRFAVVVGDVAGREGLETWGDTAMSMRSIRIFAKDTQSPRDILIKTNDELVPDLMAEASLTVVCSLIDIEAGTMTTAQSGHQPVLLANPRREPVVAPIKPSGMVLGLVRGPKFDQLLQENVTSLAEGDLIVWYTEGVLNVKDEQGREFGMERLMDVVQNHRQRGAPAFVAAVQRRLDAWRGNALLEEDQTLVAIEVSGPLAAFSGLA